MKPLIKWPGGKSKEMHRFLTMIPEFDRYIEPFVGGGAVYFALAPERAVINDTSRDLMEFYEMVKSENPKFRYYLQLYRDSFEYLKETCDAHYDDILTLYEMYERTMQQGRKIAHLRINDYFVRQIVSDPKIMTELVKDPERFIDEIRQQTEDKFIRTVENQKNGKFSPEDLKKNLMTGFLSGYYLYFRQVLNQIAFGQLKVEREYRCANFYFIREYCYGSMFRFNSKNAFNMPYGGVSYNTKDLKPKIQEMYSAKVQRLLERTRLECMDFEVLLRSMELTERDFLFLDPPHDAEDSDYGFADQQRLAAFLATTKAQFLLVAQDTPEVIELYREMEGVRMLTFDYLYLFNARNRNEKNAGHVIITNLPEGEIPWIRENYSMGDLQFD